MNFRVYILCPGFDTNSVMKLHSGRVDCILGGCGAFWAGAFSESIYIHGNPSESIEIHGNPWKYIEIHLNFRA